jgi:hypothetical protein
VGEEIVKARTAPTFDAPVGSRIWLDVDKNRIHLFDPKTNQSIL